jgi:hypothetical protein
MGKGNTCWLFMIPLLFISLKPGLGNHLFR